jgi:hypothetical protein
VQKRLEETARKQRDLRKRLRSLNAQTRNSTERKNLIETLNSMSVQNQLLLISKDDKHAVNFYPTRSADSATISIIKLLPKEVQHALAIKMKGKHRGPWGAFKKRLLSVHGPVGNMDPIP